MAVAFVRSHTVTSEKVSDVSVDLAISTATTPGNVLVARILFDNAAGAASPTVSTIAVPAGETATWARLGSSLYPSAGTSGAFASAEMWAIRTSVVWPVANYAVTLSAAVTQKATHAAEFSGVLATQRSTVGTNYSTTTTAASATTTGTTPVVGDLAVGFIFGANAAAAQAGDTDTTAGSWSAVTGVGSTGGSAATNNFGVAQYKILTAATHQTLNNSAAMTAGNGAIVAILQQYVDPAITQAAYRFYADDATAPAVLDSYPSSNYAGSSYTFYSALATDVGQSFLGDGKSLTRAGFYIERHNSVTGTVTAKLYAHTGTFGSGGTGTGAALAVSTTNVDVTTLPAGFSWVYFDFSGFLLSPGTAYVVTLSGSITGSASVYVGVGLDITSPTHAGTRCTYSGSAWSATSTQDVIFEVYTAVLSESGSTALAAQDTAPTIDTSGGDVNAQLRVRLQATTSAAVDPWDDFQLQWDKNSLGIWTNIGATSMPVDGYDETQRTSALALGNDSVLVQGQVVIGTGTALTRVGFFMRKSGTPTATITAAVYATTGSSGTYIGTGVALATSTTSIVSSTLDTAYAWRYFDFDGTFTMTAGTPFAVVAESPLGTLSNYVQLGSDPASPTHPGNSTQRGNVSGWAFVNSDTVFAVYSPGTVATYYNSPNLTDGAATTNRLTGGTGTFTAGKVSEDGLADDVGWAGNDYTELLYSLTFKSADLINGDTVRFRVLRNGVTTGLTYTTTPTVTIGGAAAVAPVASFTASASTVVQGNTVTFTDTSTNTPTTWAWDFGTGASPATATTKGPHTVTYSTVGTSTVTLTAGNTAGSDAVDTPTSITVSGTTTKTYLHHVVIAAPRNGTTTHTVSPSSGVVVGGSAFTPTAGNLLVCVVEGAVTSSTPSGWTLPSGGSAVNNSGLYLWYRTAAGSDSLSTTHNASNYPVVFHFIEFAAGSTFGASVAATGVNASGGAGPTLSGLTGTPWVAAAVGQANSSTADTVSWSAGTELAECSVAASPTDGYNYGLTYVADHGSASFSAAATMVLTGATAERLVFSVVVAGVGGGGRPKVSLDGSTFVAKPGKIWTGSAWVEKPWKIWTGSTWKTLT